MKLPVAKGLLATNGTRSSGQVIVTTEISLVQGAAVCTNEV